MRFDGLNKTECTEIADCIHLRVKRIEKTYDDNFDSCITTLTMENDNFETFACIFCNLTLMESVNLNPFQKQKIINFLDKLDAKYKHTHLNIFSDL